MCLPSVLEQPGHRHPEGEEADQAVQCGEGGRADGVLRPGERRRGEALCEAPAAAGPVPGLRQERVLPGGEEPAGVWVGWACGNRTFTLKIVRIPGGIGKQCLHLDFRDSRSQADSAATARARGIWFRCSVLLGFSRI